VAVETAALVSGRYAWKTVGGLDLEGFAELHRLGGLEFQADSRSVQWTRSPRAGRPS
jgi:hypothetical protein